MSLKDCIDKGGGFVPLWRNGWEDWDWYTDAVVTNVYLYCYKKANYKDRKYRGELIKRGTFFTSRSIIAKDLNIGEQKVRTALKKLELTNDITIKSSRKGTIITVENYGYIVNDNQQLTNRLTNSQPTTNQQLTTNNKDNKENKDNNVVVGAEAPSTNYGNSFLEFWNVYLKKKEKYKEDTLKFWNDKKYTSQEVEQILYGARMYSEEMKEDKHMVYARTFLEDEVWKRYKLEKEPLGMDVIENEMFRDLYK